MSFSCILKLFSCIVTSDDSVSLKDKDVSFDSEAGFLSNVRRLGNNSGKLF